MALLCSDVRFRMWFCHAYALTFPSAAMCNMQCAVLCRAIHHPFNTHTHMHDSSLFFCSAAIFTMFILDFWALYSFFKMPLHFVFLHLPLIHTHICVFFSHSSHRNKLNLHNSCKAKQVKRLLNHKQWTNKHNEVDNIILGWNPCVLCEKCNAFSRSLDGVWFIATPTGIWAFAAVQPAITNINEYQPSPHLAYGQGIYFFFKFPKKQSGAND